MWGSVWQRRFWLAVHAEMSETGNGPRRAIERHLGRRPRLVILGHEWVGQVFRVLRQFSCRYGFDEDINRGYIKVGWFNAHLLMLSRRFSEVHLRMAPLATDRYGDVFIEDELLAIAALAPEAIVVHLGANELLDRYNNPVDVAAEVCHLGRRLISECNVLHVCFMGCVNRLGGPRDFADRLLAFNFALSRLAASCPGMSFQKLRGFSTLPDDSGPLPVSSWSLNGFTPDPESRYFTKYIHELRAAAFQALADIDDFVESLECIPDFFERSHSNKRDPPPPPPAAAIVAC